MLAGLTSPASVHQRKQHRKLEYEHPEFAKKGGALDKWSWESDVVRNREVRMLEKIEEIKARPKWVARGPFGRHDSPVWQYINLNLGLFTWSGRRMLAHCRPTAHRMDEFVSIVFAGMTVWYGFAISVSINETFRPAPDNVSGAMMRVSQVSTGLWAMLVIATLGGLGSTVVQGVAVLSLPASEVDNFMATNAVAFSSLFSLGFNTFYGVVIAFVLRVLVTVSSAVEDDTVLGRFDNTGRIIVIALLIAGVLVTICCSWVASMSLIGTVNPWIEAHAEIQADEQLIEGQARKNNSQDDGDEGAGTAVEPDKVRRALGDLERVRKLYELGYLTSDERDSAVAQVKIGAFDQGQLPPPRTTAEL